MAYEKHLRNKSAHGYVSFLTEVHAHQLLENSGFTAELKGIDDSGTLTFAKAKTDIFQFLYDIVYNEVKEGDLRARKKAAFTKHLSRLKVLTCEVMDIMMALWNNGFAHTDFKCENILLKEDGTILICDLASFRWCFSHAVATNEKMFGRFRSLKLEKVLRIGNQSTTMYTRLFCAPEQFKKAYDGKVSIETDMYQCAMTLLFLWCDTTLTPFTKEEQIKLKNGSISLTETASCYLLTEYAPDLAALINSMGRYKQTERCCNKESNAFFAACDYTRKYASLDISLARTTAPVFLKTEHAELIYKIYMCAFIEEDEMILFGYYAFFTAVEIFYNLLEKKTDVDCAELNNIALLAVFLSVSCVQCVVLDPPAVAQLERHFASTRMLTTIFKENMRVVDNIQALARTMPYSIMCENGSAVLAPIKTLVAYLHPLFSSECQTIPQKYLELVHIFVNDIKASVAPTSDSVTQYFSELDRVLSSEGRHGTGIYAC